MPVPANHIGGQKYSGIPDGLGHCREQRFQLHHMMEDVVGEHRGIGSPGGFGLRPRIQIARNDGEVSSQACFRDPVVSPVNQDGR